MNEFNTSNTTFSVVIEKDIGTCFCRNFNDYNFIEVNKPKDGGGDWNRQPLFEFSSQGKPTPSSDFYTVSRYIYLYINANHTISILKGHIQGLFINWIIWNIHAERKTTTVSHRNDWVLQFPVIASPDRLPRYV